MGHPVMESSKQYPPWNNWWHLKFCHPKKKRSYFLPSTFRGQLLVSGSVADTGKHFILRRLYLTIHTKQAKYAREPSRFCEMILQAIAYQLEVWKFQQGMKSICSQTCWRIFHPYSAEKKNMFFCYLQYVFSLFPERCHLNHSLWTGTVFWTLAKIAESREVSVPSRAVHGVAFAGKKLDMKVGEAVGKTGRKRVVAGFSTSTPEKLTVAPARKPSQKGNEKVFQPSIFRRELLVSGSVALPENWCLEDDPAFFFFLFGGKDGIFSGAIIIFSDAILGASRPMTPWNSGKQINNLGCELPLPVW